MTKIAYGLIVVLGSLVLGAALLMPHSQAKIALPAATALYPTCSPDHDCWIAAPDTTSGALRGDHAANADRRVELPAPHDDPGHGLAEGASRSQPASFGLLVPPLTNWSGPPVSRTGSASALRLSRHRLSATLTSAFPKVRLAAKQPRAPKGRSTI